MIDGDSWSEAVAQGWRFLENCTTDAELNALRVAAARHEYGAGSVKIGMAFGRTGPARPADCVGFAIYVRDGGEMLAELQEDMLNFEHGHLMPGDQPTGAFDAIDA